MARPAHLRPLTGRELIVVHRAALGLTIAETARDLLLSPTTVHSARERAMHALGARNMAQAVFLVMRQNLFGSAGLSPYACGTPEAYHWHVKHHQPTDDACREAHAEERRAQRNRKTGRISSDSVTTR